MKLGDISTIRTGLVLSRKQARGPSGKKIPYQLLNLRSINPKGYIDTDQLDVFEASEKLTDDYLTCEGDVLVRMSAPYTAVFIDKDTSGFVVSSYFIIIRCDEKKIIPGYLCWLLNTDTEKRRIYNNTFGNVLSSIKATYFSNLEIAIPKIDKQRQIAEINALAEREIKLFSKLAYEKEKYYKQLLHDLNKSALD